MIGDYSPAHDIMRAEKAAQPEKTVLLKKRLAFVQLAVPTCMSIAALVLSILSAK